jgi:hypothetical protein
VTQPTFLADDWPNDQHGWPARRCHLCQGPILGVIHRFAEERLGGVWSFEADGDCLDAWLHDGPALAELRLAACRNGYHEFPGRWSRDPGDPYGDAGMWECKKGCGHIQRHPGYGTQRSIHELGLCDPGCGHPTATGQLELALEVS